MTCSIAKHLFSWHVFLRIIKNLECIFLRCLLNDYLECEFLNSYSIAIHICVNKLTSNHFGGYFVSEDHSNYNNAKSIKRWENSERTRKKAYHFFLSDLLLYILSLNGFCKLQNSQRSCQEGIYKRSLVLIWGGDEQN